MGLEQLTTSSAGVEKDNKNWLISQIITGVQNASQNESGLEGVVTRFPNNRSRAQVSSVNRFSTPPNINDTEDRSVVIYGRLGNLATKDLLADLFPEENIKRAVFNINTGDRRIINKVHKNQDKVIWRELATEMDNHSDTHCFGANFRPISFTSEEFNVSPFLPEYSEQMNVHICTGVTDLELDSG